LKGSDAGASADTAEPVRVAPYVLELTHNITGGSPYISFILSGAGGDGLYHAANPAEGGIYTLRWPKSATLMTELRP